jgi:hypothetical protein
MSYDARVKATQGKAASLIGKTITISGTSYACLASDLETVKELTEAGIKVSRNMVTIIDESLFTTLPDIGTLGTYGATILRLTDAITRSATGGTLRFTWEAQ